MTNISVENKSVMWRNFNFLCGEKFNQKLHICGEKITNIAYMWRKMTDRRYSNTSIFSDSREFKDIKYI